MPQKITFDKLVPEGKALGYWNDKALFAIGPLPGETAEVAITREKKTWAEARVRAIIEPSKHRDVAKEAHYLSCSPWQSVDYAYQVELKRSLLAESFKRPDSELTVSDYHGAPAPYGYRNKLEFSFMETGDGKVELAFHERGSWQTFLSAADGCVLGSDEMNAVARDLVGRINDLKLGNVIDTLTVRQSQTNGQLIAILQLTAKAIADWAHLHIPELVGVIVVVQPRHNEYKILHSYGTLELTETINGLDIVYPWNSFFQVNLPAFQSALDEIVARVRPGARVVDLYGGAGTIGLPVAKVAAQVVGIELIESSVELANTNATHNKLGNYRAISAASEKMNTELLNEVDVVIVDPPRPGLSKKVINYLIDANVPKIIYLSCNPVTQARDVLLMQEFYEPSDLVGYDFYPGTLHQESLVTLTRRV